MSAPEEAGGWGDVLAWLAALAVLFALAALAGGEL